MHNQHNLEDIKTEEIPGLAGHLVRDGLLNKEIAKKANQIVLAEHMTLTYYLVNSGILSSQAIFNYCHKKFACIIFDVFKEQGTWKQTNLILKSELIKRYRVLPIKWDHHYLYLAMTDPTD